MLMNPERWNRIKALFVEAQEYPAAGRTEFLREACDSDEVLQAEVLMLLDSDERAASFLENSAADDLPHIFETNELEELVEQRPDDVRQKLPRFARGMVLNGRYEIVQMLGKGGMGEVYLAEDNRIRRSVALKVINSDLVASDDSLERFAFEARTVSALNHPHILTIYEFDHTRDGDLFFVAEFVDGDTLNHSIGNGLPVATAIDIGKQVLAALSAAHQAGVIHRDVKPENIMVRRDGYIKVLDFGLAKIQQKDIVSVGSGSEDPTIEVRRTQPGAVVGTPAYMSPEQSRGKPLDARTDIWSFGVVLYEMLCGRRPFTGDTTADVLVSVLSKKPLRISTYRRDVPPELEALILRSLEKDAADRYQTCEELRSALEEVARQVTSGDSRFSTVAEATEEEMEQDRNVLETADYEVRRTVRDRKPTARPVSLLARSESVELRRPSRFRSAALIAAAIVLVFALGAYLTFRSPAANRTIDSVAVLPFENLSGSTDLANISDGFSDTLIDRLSEIGELKVVARTSSSKFRGADLNVADAASQLGVRAIVTGTVSRESDDVVIRIDVIDTAEDRQLMGSSFRRKTSQISRLQHEIAEMVAARLGINLSDSQRNRLVRHATEDSEAFQFYLNGLVAMNSSQDVKNSGALEHFERAVSLDPNFAEAYAEIAYILWLRANTSDEPQRVIEQARAAAERAIAADPGVAKAHAAQAMMYDAEFDWAAAERSFVRAIELNPNLHLARNEYAFFLSVMGRHDEALAQLEEHSRRDPLNRRLALLSKGIILSQAHRFDDALTAYSEAQAIEPDREIPNFTLGYAYAGKGRNDDAERYYRRSVELMGGENKYSQPLVYLAAIYAKMPGKRAEAEAIVRKIESSGQYASPAIMAVAYLALDDNDKAMELLEEAYINRDPLLRFIATGYEYDDLRGDPRFADLLRRIGLSSQ